MQSKESGFYYLQSRYYDPSIGRLINADSYISTGNGLSGYNMFAYCGNNPTMNVDHNGEYYTKGTVITSLGDSLDGIEEQRLRHYVTGGKCTKRDVTYEVDSKLEPYVREAYYYGTYAIENKWYTPFNYYKFYTWVNHEATWDIKVPQVWENTIGTTYPGFGKEVYYHSMTITPEALGNYIYGYLGAAFNFPIGILYGGSYYAAGFPTSLNDLKNEYNDWGYIRLGYDAF